jgi:CBS domain-containing protein
MGKVRQILQEKGTAVFTVPPSITIYQALEIMADKNVGGLLVTENDKLVGIFTERDYARKLILKGKSSKDTTINQLMTPNPFTVEADTGIDECMKLMSDKHIRHLPVVENGGLIGIISIGDVVRFIIDEQRYIIEHLEQYITGR